MIQSPRAGWGRDRCVSFSDDQSRRTSGIARRIQFPHHIGKEKHVGRRDVHGFGDRCIARARNFRTCSRIEVAGDERRQITIAREAKEKLLSLRGTG